MLLPTKTTNSIATILYQGEKKPAGGIDALVAKDSNSDTLILQGDEAQDWVLISTNSVKAKESIQQLWCAKEDIPKDTYTVCYGLTNQIVGHAAFIAS